jgi:hypothetical protein
VKLWIRLLDQQRLGKERKLADDEVEALVRGEQALLLEEEEEDADGSLDTFLGLPIKKPKKQ